MCANILTNLRSVFDSGFNLSLFIDTSNPFEEDFFELRCEFEPILAFE